MRLYTDMGDKSGGAGIVNGLASQPVAQGPLRKPGPPRKLGAVILTTTAGSTAVVCNEEGDCWGVPGEPR